MVFLVCLAKVCRLNVELMKGEGLVFQRLILAVCVASVLMILVAVNGCGRGDGMVSISGTVSLDGVPVEYGNMRIVASDSPVSGAGIADGKFETRATVGKKTITIYAFKQDGEIEDTNIATGEKVKNPKYVPLLENGSLYGELTSSYEIDVKKGGGNFTIDLKSAELLKK
jgi:hypothetical protein